MISLFIFACVAVEVIAKDKYLAETPATSDIVLQQFFGLNRAMLTLIQFVTLDNIAEVYYPLIMHRPFLCVYFFPILIFISIGLMNLVTAALVENAMQTAAHEAEEERLKLKKRVRGACDSAVGKLEEAYGGVHPGSAHIHTYNANVCVSYVQYKMHIHIYIYTYYTYET